MNYLKSRTIQFGLILTILSIIQIFIPYLPPQYIGITGTVVGALVIFFRFITTIPLSQK